MQKSYTDSRAGRIVLRLYFTGQSPNSTLAKANLKLICDQHLAGRHAIELIDVLAQPLRLIRDNIPTTPLLVRIEPLPERRILGDLSNLKQVLAFLEIAAP